MSEDTTIFMIQKLPVDLHGAIKTHLKGTMDKRTISEFFIQAAGGLLAKELTTKPQQAETPAWKKILEERGEIDGSR